MMVWSINILVLAVGFFIVGMINPKWLLFWMEKPGRTPIVIFCAMLFMVAAVMFGEASAEKNKLQVEQAMVKTKSASDSAPSIAVETVKKLEKELEKEMQPVN